MLVSRSPKENLSVFREKRFIPRVVTGAKCRLPNDAVKVYSFLVYKARDGRPVTPTLITRRTGLERGRSGKETGKARGVPRLLELLIAEGLVRKVQGGCQAIEPTGPRREWFAWKQGRDGDWHRSLATYKVYTLAPGVKRKATGGAVVLTQSASDLYFLMASLAGWKGRLIGQTRAGLATLLRVSRPTVAAGLRLLQELDLAKAQGNGFALGYPTVETLALWQVRKAAAPSRSKPKMTPPPAVVHDPGLDETIRYCLEGKGRKSDIEAAIPAVLGHELMLRRAGYSDEAIRKLLIATLRLFPGPNEVWFYFQTGPFLDAFSEAEAQHSVEATIHGRPSVDLLIYKVKEVARGVRC
jgi:hypothetical protein